MPAGENEWEEGETEWEGTNEGDKGVEREEKRGGEMERDEREIAALEQSARWWV
jgi:hypothetical protein